ncbi:MAG: class I SAM-dependent methyltransferase [Chitinophagaceae bacterium]
MSLAHHKDPKLKYQQQVDNAKEYVVPFILKTCTLTKQSKVLEIGCGEGGVLKPFYDIGCECIGVDLDKPRLDLANTFLKEEVETGRMQFLYQNVMSEEFLAMYTQYFDLIILKDVIEHIHDQENFIPFMKKLLTEQGQIFFGFPPWYMPFGGHQQIAEKKITSKLPYYHLLPMPLFLGFLKLNKEKENTILTLKEVKETGISIERFERICKKNNYTIVNKQWFLINPIYQFKFGLKPRKQNVVFGLIPFVRNFLTTCAYYTIAK